MKRGVKSAARERCALCRIVLLVFLLFTLINFMAFFGFDAYVLCSIRSAFVMFAASDDSPYFFFLGLLIWALFAVCWFLSKKRKPWLIAGVALLGLDTLFAVVSGAAVCAVRGPENYLAYVVPEIVCHVAAVALCAADLKRAAKAPSGNAEAQPADAAPRLNAAGFPLPAADRR